MSEAPLRLVVNGEAHTLPVGSTVRHLLKELGLDRDGIAVAVDRAIVPRSALDTTVLTDGATVDIVRAVGGG